LKLRMPRRCSNSWRAVSSSIELPEALGNRLRPSRRGLHPVSGGGCHPQVPGAPERLKPL
jgi:hypothetical protein